MVKKKAVSKKSKFRKSTTRVSSISGRATCATPKCRKAVNGEAVYCARCLDAQDGFEAVVRLSELEALQFAKMDTELRNSMQGKELIRYKLQAVESDYRAKKAALDEDFNNLAQAIQRLQPIYVTFVREMAAKYGFESDTQISIDPDTRVIRDLGAAKKS